MLEDVIDNAEEDHGGLDAIWRHLHNNPLHLLGLFAGSTLKWGLVVLEPSFWVYFSF